MALTLGSTAATQGTDFSTTVSGFTAGSVRTLVDNENGVFHLSDIDDTTAWLTAGGADLGSLTAPGVASLAIDEKTGFNAPVRTYFTVTIARAGATTPVSVVMVPPQTFNVGSVVSIAAPTVNGMTAPYTYALVDARGFNRRTAPTGVAINTTTGAISGTIMSRQGAYDLVVRVTDANGRVAYSNPFSIGVYASSAFTVADILLGADGQQLLGFDGQLLFGAVS